MLANEFNCRLRNMWTIQTRLTVNIRCVLCRTNQRPIHAHGYRNIANTCQGTDFESITCDLLERLIACYCGDGEQINLRMTGGQKYGDGIVVSRVAIEDNFMFQSDVSPPNHLTPKTYNTMSR